MDHRFFLKSLSPETRQRLTARNNISGLVHLTIYGGMIGILVSLILLQVPYWPFLMLPLGVLQVFLFTLLHETVHNTPFRTGWLNQLTARLSSFIILLPADWFRFFHLAHHRFTQDPTRDPELAAAKPETMAQYIWHVSGLPIWAGQLKILVRNSLGQGGAEFIPTKALRRIIKESRLQIALYTILFGLCVYFEFTAILRIWIIPLLLGQPFLRLYLLAEHGRCPLVVDMFQNTRTTFTNRAMRFLAWNMPYHTEHHTYPTVPYHQLPELHKLIQNHLTQTEQGYIQFNKRYIDDLKSR